MKKTKNINLSFDEKTMLFHQLQTYIGPDTRLVIGLSGGPDSIFVTRLLQDFFVVSGYSLKNLFIVHCNHATRKENNQEEQFIKDIFSYLQVDIAQRSGGSQTESSLRGWRYSVFEKFCIEHDIDYVVTGHNLTDRIETTFLNLLRGCGSKGFIGMQFCDDSPLLSSAKVLRPLLMLSKGQITALCDEHQFEYMQDPTNQNNETSLRNKLRNDILPLLYKLSHKSTDQTNTFLESMQHVYDSLDSDLKPIISLVPFVVCPMWEAEWGYIWNIDQVDITSDSIVQVLNHLGIYKNIDKQFIDELTLFLREKTKGYKYFNGVYFFVAHQKIYLIKAPQFFWEKKSAYTEAIDHVGVYDFDGYRLLIDEKELIGSTLRYMAVGDIYQGKKLSKWFINQKIPLFWRNFVPLAEKDGKIIKVFNEVIK